MKRSQFAIARKKNNKLKYSKKRNNIKTPKTGGFYRKRIAFFTKQQKSNTFSLSKEKQKNNVFASFLSLRGSRENLFILFSTDRD